MKENNLEKEILEELKNYKDKIDNTYEVECNKALENAKNLLKEVKTNPKKYGSEDIISDIEDGFNEEWTSFDEVKGNIRIAMGNIRNLKNKLSKGGIWAFALYILRHIKKINNINPSIKDIKMNKAIKKEIALIKIYDIKNFSDFNNTMFILLKEISNAKADLFYNEANSELGSIIENKLNIELARLQLEFFTQEFIKNM